MVMLTQPHPALDAICTRDNREKMNPVFGDSVGMFGVQVELCEAGYIDPNWFLIFIL